MATVAIPAPVQHAAPAAEADLWHPLLRRHGLPVTAARVLVLQALAQRGHATPEQIYNHASSAVPGLNPSTVYRTLEVLADYQLITHAHLEQPSATYMLASHADHAHLVCRGCRAMTEIDHDIATTLAALTSNAHGFDVDIGHLSIFGRCDKCADEDLGSQPADRP